MTADSSVLIDFLIGRNIWTAASTCVRLDRCRTTNSLRSSRQSWGAGVGLPATKWMLEIGAFFLRTETEFDSEEPARGAARLPDSGFEFCFSDWPSAARDLVSRCANGTLALLAARGKIVATGSIGLGETKHVVVSMLRRVPVSGSTIPTTTVSFAFQHLPPDTCSTFIPQTQIL